MSQRIPETSSDLAERLHASAANLHCERSCILTLVTGGVRAFVVEAGIVEAMAEARRRRGERDGGFAAAGQFQAAA